MGREREEESVDKDHDNNDDLQWPRARHGHACCVHNDALFMFGGHMPRRDSDDKPQLTSNALFRFDLATHEWTLLVAANDARFTVKARCVQ